MRLISPAWAKAVEMLWTFSSGKEIALETRLHPSRISKRANELGLRKAYVTDDERRLLLERRKLHGVIR